MSRTDDQPLEENADATLNEERETEDQQDDNFDDIFDNDQEINDGDDAPVTREEYNRLVKGVQKLASQKGREKKEVKEDTGKKADTASDDVNPVLKNLYLKANPEAETVWDDVVKEAKNLGKDPFELYESSNYFKGEAKARLAQKEEEEANKAKIDRPSTGANLSKKDITSLSQEEVNKLSGKDMLKYLEAMAEKERRSVS